MHLSALFLYPVKSLRGCAAAAADLDDLGLVGDRRFMLIDSDGRFLTQRTEPRLALINSALEPGQLVLSAAGAGSVAVPRAADPAAPRRLVSVWKSEGLTAEDAGEPAAEWLGAFLGRPVRLVRLGADFRRPVRKFPAAFTERAIPLVTFADGYPFLIVGEGSLADLNDRLIARGEVPVPMDRFRPNLVIAGAPPFAEDTWPRFRVGEVVFRGAGPCGRCIVTTTDQQTGERGHEPLRTLAAYRRDAIDPTNVNFGQNLIAESIHGTLQVGDPVAPL